MIRTGGAALQLLHIHRTFPELIQGLALLFIAGRAIMEHVFLRMHERASAAPENPENTGGDAPEKGTKVTQKSEISAPGGQEAAREARSAQGGE